MEDAACGVEDRAPEAALEVGEDTHVDLAQLFPIVGEEEDRQGDDGEHEDVEHTIQGDQAQDETIAQRTAA